MGIELIKIVDKYLGSVLCLSLGLFTRKKTVLNAQKKTPKNILAIQLWGIGETILTLPAVGAIKKKFPTSKITLLVTDRNKAVYEHCEYVDEIISLKMNPLSLMLFVLKNFQKYELVIDFEEYLNNSSIISFFAGKERIGFSHGVRAKIYNKTVPYNDCQYTAKTFLDLGAVVGCNSELKKLERLKTTALEQKRVEALWEQEKLNERLVIGITAGAAESARSRIWPTERFAETINRISKTCATRNKKPMFILVGADFDRKVNDEVLLKIKNKNNVIDCIGRFSLRETFYLVEKCDLFISNDTGPMHIAAAQGVKTIGLFGPNTPVRWGPFGKGNISLYKMQGTRPCINTHLGEVGSCRDHPNGECIRKISVDDVINAVDKILNSDAE